MKHKKLKNFYIGLVFLFLYLPIIVQFIYIKLLFGSEKDGDSNERIDISNYSNI